MKNKRIETKKQLKKLIENADNNTINRIIEAVNNEFCPCCGSVLFKYNNKNGSCSNPFCEKYRQYKHDAATEISIILDKHDVSCPLEKQEVIKEINARFIEL